MSETDSARPWLARFCVGVGLDIGCGPEPPIVSTAIAVDKRPPACIVCDAATLPFTDESLDYVYSSHCLEDFEDTASVLKEWLRVIKPKGHLVLFCPDQQAYEAHCKKHGTLPNQDHKHAEFGYAYVASILSGIDDGLCIVHHEYPCTYNPYSFALVCRKVYDHTITANYE